MLLNFTIDGYQIVREKHAWVFRLYPATIILVSI